MVVDFIMSHIPYEDALQWLGFVIIFQSLAVNKLAKYKRETLFALIPLWFLTFGALLVFGIVGYILAIIMVFVTIYSIVYSIRKKVTARKTSIKRISDTEENNSV